MVARGGRARRQYFASRRSGKRLFSGQNLPVMMHSRLFARTISLALCVALSACVNQKVSPATRAAVRTASVVNPPKGAEPGFYGDQTGSAVMVGGMAFGLIGSLVASGIAASNRTAGLQRWESVNSSKRSLVLARVRENTAREFGRAAGIRFSDSGVPDAKLVFSQISYGVQHTGDQRFAAAILAQVQLKRSADKTVWRGMATGLSTTSRTLEEFQRDPRAFDAALEEAAAKLARELASHY